MPERKTRTAWKKIGPLFPFLPIIVIFQVGLPFKVKTKEFGFGF